MTVVTPQNLSWVDWSKLPAPRDDGAASHLRAMTLPDIALAATDGTMVALASLAGRTVLYIYPMTGQPGTALPDGWDDIPGARGCTPQACAFRDHYADLREAGAAHVFGLSTQQTSWQQEAAARLHLPFALLSDSAFALTKALRLPTFEASGQRLLKRMALIIDDGVIAHVFYPVFPPDRNAADVLAWLGKNPR
jgi:peroxiredoxin